MQFYAGHKPVIDKVKNKKEITELCHVCKHARIRENGGVRMVEGCEKGMVVCDDFEAIGARNNQHLTMIPVELNGKNIAHAIFASEKERNNQMKSIEIKADGAHATLLIDGVKITEVTEFSISKTANTPIEVSIKAVVTKSAEVCD